MAEKSRTHLYCRVECAAFFASGRYIAAVLADGAVCIYDSTTGVAIKSFIMHEGHVYAIALSQDGDLGLTGSGDHTVRQWNTASGHLISILGEHHHTVRSVALSANGLLALSGSYDGTVKYWDTTTGKVISSLEKYDKDCCVALSADKCLAFLGSTDGTIRRWNAESRTLLCHSQEPEKGVIAVAISIDGRHTLSASEDGTIKLWDARMLTCRAIFFTCDDMVLPEALHFPGPIVAGDCSGRVHILDLVE